MISVFFPVKFTFHLFLCIFLSEEAIEFAKNQPSPRMIVIEWRLCMGSIVKLLI